MNNEMIETLISKFIDSEITPAEQRLLDEELTSNPESRQLLHDLQQLRDQSCQLLDEQLYRQGDSAETFFQKACEQKDSLNRFQIIRPSRFWKWAASMAACLLIALTIWMVWVARQPNGLPAQPETINIAENSPVPDDPVEPRFNPRWVRDITPTTSKRYIDWYTYTAPSGSQYLIESYRDHSVTTASTHEGL